MNNWDLSTHFWPVILDNLPFFLLFACPMLTLVRLCFSLDTDIKHIRVCACVRACVRVCVRAGVIQILKECITICISYLTSS